MVYLANDELVLVPVCPCGSSVLYIQKDRKVPVSGFQYRLVHSWVDKGGQLAGHCSTIL